ncbi:core protein [Eastern grey kangaroopox virus]|uniref:Core protein n=1 Tax=Eastern grey kangaroopox virus TaxID=2042482 RepID=A0A2C9DT84_9POXV|nr:core protein [Eastern grey kangaroopox virus]ATI21217.1 core protein [Eastern grey kangaroopox virus]ATX75122.1 core protein [Eastern grey kangaroopox virus]
MFVEDNSVVIVDTGARPLCGDVFMRDGTSYRAVLPPFSRPPLHHRTCNIRVSSYTDFVLDRESSPAAVYLVNPSTEQLVRIHVYLRSRGWEGKTMLVFSW